MGVDRLKPEGALLQRLRGEWQDVQSMLLEELSMWPPLWLWALAVRLGYVCHDVGSDRGIDPDNPMQAFFGAIELMRMNVDF